MGFNVHFILLCLLYIPFQHWKLTCSESGFGRFLSPLVQIIGLFIFLKISCPLCEPHALVLSQSLCLRHLRECCNNKLDCHASTRSPSRNRNTALLYDQTQEKHPQIGKTTDLSIKQYMIPLLLFSSVPSSLPFWGPHRSFSILGCGYMLLSVSRSAVGKSQLQKEPSLDSYFDNPQIKGKSGEVSRIVHQVTLLQYNLMCHFLHSN